MPIPTIAYLGAGAVGLYFLVKKFKGSEVKLPEGAIPLSASTAKLPSGTSFLNPDGTIATTLFGDTVVRTDKLAPDGGFIEVIPDAPPPLVRGTMKMPDGRVLPTINGSPVDKSAPDLSEADLAEWAAIVDITPAQFREGASAIGLTPGQLVHFNDPALIMFALATAGISNKGL